jgi:NADPH-dependent 2,4-dienoyl-CoA reductase/sulfur reductase-like enzyme
MAAASVLVGAGMRPIVIDEGTRPGGQIFRIPQAPLMRSVRKLYGFDAKKAEAFHNEAIALDGAIDLWRETQIWDADRQQLYLLGKESPRSQPWTHLILACGAMDRIVPVKGWTAPGVFSLGGAQIALKAEAALIGQRVIFAGSGPLLYLVAYQYARAGASVAAVLETGLPFSRVGELPGLISGKRAFARGLFYMAALRGRGIPLKTGVQLGEIGRGGSGHVSGIKYRWRGRDHFDACDGLALGHGLKAETQIADLLGLEFAYDELQRQWLPYADSDGRSSLEGVYLAGDGLAIRGSELAAATGRLAASALLEDLGYATCAKSRRDRNIVNRAMKFRAALDRTFAYPSQAAATLADDVVVCRCEGITAGTIRDAVAHSSESDINRIKAFCRVGMGRCQGRLCSSATAELIAAAANTDLRTVGRIRGQAPVKPVSLAALVGRVR